MFIIKNESDIFCHSQNYDCIRIRISISHFTNTYTVVLLTINPKSGLSDTHLQSQIRNPSRTPRYTIALSFFFMMLKLALSYSSGLNSAIRTSTILLILITESIPRDSHYPKIRSKNPFIAPYAPPTTNPTTSPGTPSTFFPIAAPSSAPISIPSMIESKSPFLTALL